MTKVTNAFHWQDDKRPSIFATDNRFNGYGHSKPKAVDLTPNKESHITTQAEAMRTRSILLRSI